MNPATFKDNLTHEQAHALAVAHESRRWKDTDEALKNLISVVTIFLVAVLPVVAIHLYRVLL